MTTAEMPVPSVAEKISGMTVGKTCMPSESTSPLMDEIKRHQVLTISSWVDRTISILGEPLQSTQQWRRHPSGDLTYVSMLSLTHHLS